MSHTSGFSSSIFEAIPVPLCICDYSVALDYLRSTLLPSNVSTEAVNSHIRAGVALIRVKAANPAVLKLFQVLELPGLETRLQQLHFSGECPEFLDEFLAFARGSAAFDAELRLGGDGGPTWLRLQAAVPGTPPDYGNVVLTYVEITGLRAAEYTAREANTFLDAVVENIPNMIFVKEARELRFIRFNRAGEELLGIPREQTYGKNDYDFFPRTEADFFTAKDREVLDGGAMVDIPEEPIHTARGIRWLHTKKVPLYLSTREPAYLLGISEDITDFKEVAEALALRSAELERSNQDLEQFSYVASHDLNEPLRTIGTFVQFLREEIQDQLSEDASRYLDVIRQSVTRMRALIQGILECSRVGRHPHQPVPVPMSELTAEVLVDLQAPIQEAGAHITVDALPVVVGDRLLLSRVIQNLVGNALKFRRPGVPLQVNVSASTQGQWTTFVVKDNGIGFDSLYSDQIFGMFKRLNAMEEYQGAGIGLAVCRRIIEDHGGHISAFGEPNVGARFEFTLLAP